MSKKMGPVHINSFSNNYNSSFDISWSNNCNYFTERMDYFGKSSSAGEETKMKTAEEKMNLKITTVQMKSYTETQTMPTLQYLADELCEDNDMEYVHLKQEEQAGLEKITVGETDSILTKLKEYPYEFEIDNNLKLASINGTKIAQNNDEQNSITTVDLTISNVAYNGFKINATATSTNNIICYVYIVNGQLKGSCAENEFTVSDLQAGTEYNVMVVAIDSNGDAKKSSIKKQMTSSEIIFDKAFLQSGSTYGNVTITENNYNGSAGLKMVGVSSNHWSDADTNTNKIRWYKDINMSNLNNFEFYVKKVVDHGSMKIYIDNVKVLDEYYSNLPTDWTKYTVDLTDYTGVHTINIVGGYTDSSGSGSSETQFCDIKINNTTVVNN